MAHGAHGAWCPWYMVQRPEPRAPRLRAQSPEAPWSMSVVHGIHGMIPCEILNRELRPFNYSRGSDKKTHMGIPKLQFNATFF